MIGEGRNRTFWVVIWLTAYAAIVAAAGWFYFLIQLARLRLTIPKGARIVKNRLFYGDNLDILRDHIADESVDLIYLDPPFNSNRNYNALFQEKSGEDSASQIQAFTDTWVWNMDAAYAYNELARQHRGDDRGDVVVHRLVGEPQRKTSSYSAYVSPQDIPILSVASNTISRGGSTRPAGSNLAMRSWTAASPIP